MKKYSAIFVALGALCLTSCSDDKDPDEPTIVVPSTSVSEAVKGSFGGYATVSCAYFSNQVSADETLKVTDLGDNKVKIELSSGSWGDIVIPEATVSASGDTYAIEGSGTSTMGMGGNVKEYACTVSGKMVGGAVDYTFSVPSVMGGLTIVFRDGDVPASVLLPGTYKGWTQASFQYAPTPMKTADQEVVITAAEGDKFTVKYTSSTWGEFTIENVAAVYVPDDKKFDLTGEGTSLMGMDPSNIKSYVCNFTGSVDVDKENPSFVFVLPAVMGGLKIEFFSGEMPAE